MGDEGLVNESRLNLAHILSTACLMDKARLTLSQIDTARLTPDQFLSIIALAPTCSSIRLSTCRDPQYAAEYVQQLIDLRRS